MIRLYGVTVARGPNMVVEGLHLEVGPGAVFWLVGPNGAGKTSLLRVIAGLDAPRSGHAQRDVDLRYFQSEMGLPASATVGSWDRLVARLLATGDPSRTPLWPDVEPPRRVGRLSTGQRKRLLLDAVLRQPGHLALDEPFEHLSPGAKADLLDLLRRRSRSRVVIVATNQRWSLEPDEQGLHLEAGLASRLDDRP